MAPVSAGTGVATNAASASASASSRESAASIAPASIAASGSGATPTTVASSRARAASPSDPPIRPVPTTTIRTRLGRRRAQSLARHRGGLLDPGGVLGEGVGAQRLRPVADRLLRLGVDLHDDAVRA